MSNYREMRTAINGRMYAGIKCGTFKALSLAGKLAPVIMAALSGKDISESLQKGDLLEVVAKDLLSNVSCDSKSIEADDHFVQYPQDLLPVISWSASEQVLPYFTAEAVQTISQALTGEVTEEVE